MGKRNYKTNTSHSSKSKKRLSVDDVNSLPILGVLDKLGISYADNGNEIIITDERGYATRRVVNVQGNYVNDWSHDRPSGPPFAMIRNHLKLEAREVFDRVRNTFY